MAKLVGVFGLPRSGKMEQLLRMAEDAKLQGRSVKIIKPICNDPLWDNDGWVTSKNGRSREADIRITDSFHLLNDYDWEGVSLCLVTRVHALSVEQIRQLRKLADQGVEVVAYGWRFNPDDRLHPGSQEMFRVADDIRTLMPNCFKCMQENATHWVERAEVPSIRGPLNFSLCDRCYGSYELGLM